MFYLLYEIISSALPEDTPARLLSQHSGRRVEAAAGEKGALGCPSQTEPGACPEVQKYIEANVTLLLVPAGCPVPQRSSVYSPQGEVAK